jgi:prophage DNA circulation protein
MTDILARLHECSWRGIEFPVTRREFGFSQDQEAHRFIFRDEQLIESLGLTNPTYRYTIPFREDIARGPWKNLFVDVYPKFLDACTDRTKGILDDAVHGPVQCKVASLQETADPNRRDGVDVEVNFITAPDEDFSRTELGTQLSSVQGAQGLQGALDAQTAELDDATKKQLADLNKDASVGRVNPLDFATGALNQVEVLGNQIAAGFGDVVFRMQRLDDSLARLRRPDLAPMRSVARALAMQATDLQQTALTGNASRNRVVRIYEVPAPIGKMALASALGSSIGDLLKLNPNIARATVVPTGTQVAYFG